jgi:hypothetical protein
METKTSAIKPNGVLLGSEPLTVIFSRIEGRLTSNPSREGTMRIVNKMKGSILFAIAAAFSLGIFASPAPASAAPNNVTCYMVSWNYWFPANKRVRCMATDYISNPITPYDIVATESANGQSVVLDIQTSAPGGIIATAPCTKNGTTVTCPLNYAPNNFVTGVEFIASRGDNAVTADLPSLHVRAIMGGGNDEIVVAASTTSYVSGGAGNDTLIGGIGQDQMDAGKGADFIDVDDGTADTVYCGSAAIESPVDVVDADATDSVSGNCQSVY